MFKSKIVTLLALVVLMTVPVGTALAQGAEPVLISAPGTATGEGTAVIWDDVALSDAITYVMTGVSPPSDGMAYVRWLVSEDAELKLNTGPMAPGADGNLVHTFDHNSDGYTGDNLISLYNTVMITEEAAGTAPATPTGWPVFSHVVPVSAIGNIRGLLSSWPTGADKGILTNLKEQLEIAGATAILASKAETIESLKTLIHQVINVIEGQGGANFDAASGNPGDGEGILLYAQKGQEYAGKARDAAPGDETIGAHTALVEITGKNAEDLVTKARDESLRALGQSDIAIAKLVFAWVRGALDQAIVGVDADADGAIDAIDGEGAADRAYVEAQRVATYALAPGAPPTPTPVPTATPVPTPEPTPVPPAVGGASVSALGQIAPLAAGLLVAVGGLLLAFGTRRSRTRA